MTLEDYVTKHRSNILGKINKVSRLFRLVISEDSSVRAILDNCQYEIFNEMFHQVGSYNDFEVSHYCIGDSVTKDDINEVVKEVESKLSDLEKSLNDASVIAYNGFEIYNQWIPKTDVLEVNKIRWKNFPKGSYKNLDEFIKFMENPKWVNAVLFNDGELIEI